MFWRTVFKNRRVGHSRLSGNLFSLDLLTDSEEGKQMDVKSSPRLPLCAIYGIVFPLLDSNGKHLYNNGRATTLPIYSRLRTLTHSFEITLETTQFKLEKNPLLSSMLLLPSKYVVNYSNFQ